MEENLTKLACDAFPVMLKQVTLEDGSIETVDINKRAREAFRIGYLTGQSEDFVSKIRKETKESILNKLPKWKSATRDIDSDSIEFLVKYRHDGGDGSDWDEVVPTNRLHEGENYLEISDLIELSV